MMPEPRSQQGVGCPSSPPPTAPTATPTMAERPTLEELFETEESPLLRFAYGIVGRREIAEDLVQEAFFRLHRHWEGVESPRAWIYRAVRNLCLSWIRDHRRETSLDDREGAMPPDTDAPRPDEELGRMEAAGMVRLFLAELEPVDRELVRLKYHEGLKYAEIATRTGLSVGNVGYRLHHLLRGLAVSLNRLGITGSGG